tara:strand:- start:472 stop:690 length:219 start_codon:yes stop_codon:yes gene_type:complete
VRFFLQLFVAFFFENFTLGANFRWTSGRPLNSFGYHPTDLFASYYDAESFVKDGELVSRGSEGRTLVLGLWI